MFPQVLHMIFWKKWYYRSENVRIGVGIKPGFVAPITLVITFDWVFSQFCVQTIEPKSPWYHLRCWLGVKSPFFFIYPYSQTIRMCNCSNKINWQIQCNESGLWMQIYHDIKVNPSRIHCQYAICCSVLLLFYFFPKISKLVIFY